MRYVILLVLFLTNAFSSPAQNLNSIDSLEAILETATDTTQLSVYEQLYQATIHTEPKRARAYTQSWLTLARALNEPEDEYGALLGLGRSYYVQGDFAQAVHYGEQAMIIAQSLNDTARIAGAYNGVGYMIFNQGKYDKSLEYLLQGLRLNEVLNDSLAVHKSKFNIANVYVMNDNPRKAIDYYLSCEKYFSQRNLDPLSVKCWLNLGATYPDVQQYDSSYQYYQLALDYYEAQNDEYHLAKVLDGLGQNRMDQEQYPAAINNYQQALRYNQAIENQDGIALNYRDLGRVYTLTGQYTTALDYLHQALALSEEIDAPQQVMMNHYEILAETYATQGNHAQAYDYWLKYFEVYQGIYNQEKEQQIAELETEYQLDKKEQEIALQAQEIELLAQQNTIAGYQRWGLMGGFLLITGFIGLWYNRQRLKHQKERELMEKDQVIAQEKIKSAELAQQQLQQQLDFKNRELTTHALHLGQKTELLEEVKSKINDLWAIANPRSKAEIKQLKQLMRGDQLIESDWNSFIQHFKQVHPDFSQKLSSVADELTPNEIRLAMMLKMNLSSKEIASIANISPEGVKKARYRLRKKLNIASAENVQEYILQI